MNQNNENWANGRIAFISGASAGFGQALAKKIIAAGGMVIGAARRLEKLKQLQSELGENFFPLQMDIAKTDEIENLFQTLPEKFSNIDILFNNAGLALGINPAPQASLNDWDVMIDTNIRGLVHITRNLLPRMVNCARADIINVSSVAASYPYLGGNVYGATKAFVRQFSLNLRSDLLGSNVRVTSIEPGMCETEFSIVRFGGDTQKAKSVYQGMQPLSADDIALAIEGILRLPSHINVNAIEIMPIRQAFAGFAVKRD